MLKSKRLLSVLFAIVMLIQTLPLTGFAADVEGFVDFPTGSWSEEAMTAAVDNGLIVGTSETTIEPKKNLTRAEFAAIVTRAFGATEKADISKFKDVDANQWYAEPVAKVVQMGVMQGTGATTFDPNAFMKREDVILALARVLFVDGNDTSVLNQFSDRDKIDSWSVKAIAGMVNEGYVNGYEDGTIRPLNYITREELAQLFHNIFKTYISEDGEFDSVAKKGSVIVRSKYVTLKDVTIDGDLIMADGIGDGDFRISNVHVTGKIIARGGEGMNYFVNVTSDGKVIVNDPNGTVNFYNYREEDTPFKGGNVIENTPATFLEREPAKPSIGGGGPTAKYDFFVYVSYDDMMAETNERTSVKNKSSSYRIKDNDVPSDAEMEALAPAGYVFKGWLKKDSVEGVKQRDYLVGKSIKEVNGVWYPYFERLPGEYTITFVTPEGEVPVEKTEGETIDASEIPSITVDESKEFLGWTKTDGSTNVDFTNDELTADVVENVFDSTEVKLYPVIKDRDVTEIVFKHPDGDVKVTKYDDPDYVLVDSDVPADPSKADHTFKGWAKDPAATEGEERDYFIGKKISEVEGTWYPIFEEIGESPVTYTVSFKYTDNSEALPTVEKSLTSSEDYVLTSADVKDVAHPTAPADYEFLGWTETVDGTDYKTSAELQVSIRDLNGKTYYAQFEKVTDNYTVVFKYTDGTEINKVEKTLSASEDYTLTSSDVSDVDYHTNPADYTFLGWTDTVDGTDYKTSAELQVSIKDLDGKTYYAQYERNETTYTVSFKYEDGSEALPTVEKNLVASEDYVLTNADVYDVEHPTAPADYKFLGWAEAGSTTVVSSEDLEVSIRDLNGKTYYAQFEKVTDNYTVVFKYTDGTEINKVEKTLSASEDYTLTSSNVSDVDYHTNPADYTFLGWTDTVDGTDYKTSAELQVSIKDLDGKTYYAQYERNETTYTVSFKYEDGSEALPTVEKNLVASEDYVLTNADVYDVEHPTAPADYAFLGWTETVDGTDYKTSAELQVSIRDLNGKTYYAQFEKVTDNYTVVFKYTDGTEINKVEKTLSASEDYTLTSSDVSDVDYHTNPADYTFLGWTDTVDGTDYKTSAELQVSIKDLDGKTYYAQYERNETTYTVSFKYEDGSEALPTVEKNLVASEDYVLTNADVYDVEHPTAPADYKFIGWAEAGSTTVVLSEDLEVSIRDLDGKTYYAQFEEIEKPVTYKVEFKYTDGSEALPTVEKSLLDSEDYVLTESDVYDVVYPGGSLDYEFLGWTDTVDGTDYKTSAELRVSVKDLDGTVYYAQFKEIERPVDYKVEFKYTDGSEALPTVEKSLLDAEDYVLTNADVYDVEYFEEPEMYEFLGWTEAVDGTDYMTSAELQVSIKTLGAVYYAQFKHVDEVLYKVEHYFEQLDGTYVLETTEELYEYPGIDVTATALTTLPEGYDKENEDHADRVAEGTVLADGSLTLKLYYDLKVITVRYYDLAVDTENPAWDLNGDNELVYSVKYGGTIDNFYYPDDEFDATVNEEIKAEIAEYIEYIKIAGYGKEYDDEYLYNEFEDELGGDYYPMYPHFNYDYEHEINFKWYVEDDVEEFVVFDEDHVFTEDLNLYSKIKKLNVEFIFPEKLTEERLTLNIPYEESTRFLDSIRDALFINDNIATFPDMTGVEEKFYDKMSNVGGRVFGDDGVFNDEYEINNTDIFVYFYQMMGGKASYRKWLWEEVETEVENSLGPRGEGKPRSQYESLRTMGLNQEQALYTFFEENYFELDFTGELAFAYGRYVDSKRFINDSTNKDQFVVTVNNDFIMEKVEEKISSLASVDSVIAEYGGGRVPEGLLNRLPMDIVEDIYEPRIQRFLNQLEEARYDAAHGEPEENCMVDSGILFDVNLVEELLIPGMEFAEESHTKAVNKAKNSNNKAAELIEKYYVDNPYTTGTAGNYGAVNYAFNPYFYVEDTDGDGFYTIRSFEAIYNDVVMPESVESIDALLWFMDPEGGAVDFAKIRNLAEENEALILALHNHPNNLMAKYAVEGLPENMSEYWEDLLSDPEIKAAVEKLDNKVSFDMMYFVESKIQNETLKMYYLKVLDKAGVPVENILSKYTNSKAYKELTSADFNKLLDQIEECWETVDVDGVPVVNANGTTDYVFDNVLEKVGSSGDVAQASIKGFEVVITRFFADDLFQVAP